MSDAENTKKVTLKSFRRDDMRKMDHPVLIDKYLEEAKKDKKFRGRFRSIVSRGLERDILEKYFIEGKSVESISEEVGISHPALSRYLIDYLMRNYDDSQVEKISVLQADNHFTLLDSFFASVLYATKDAAMNALFAAKIREELAKSIAQKGIIETAKDKSLMRAWEQASQKIERYGKLANEHLKTYLSLMEQVLDRQRDVAVVRVLFDLLQRLEPEVHERLVEALQKDEYARAVFDSLPGESLVNVFTIRHNADDFSAALEEKAKAITEQAQRASASVVDEEIDI